MQNTQLYLPRADKFFDVYDGRIYTNEELDIFRTMEIERNKLIPTLNFYELIDLFGPHCYAVVKRSLLANIKQLKKEQKNNSSRKNELFRLVVNKLTGEKNREVKKMVETGYDDRMNKLNELIESKSRRLSFIKGIQRKEKEKIMNVAPDAKDWQTTEADIEEAKQVSIETVFPTKLRRMGGRALGLCPFHNEKTPSLTVYINTNTWHCFGCHEGRDVVDFVMKLQKVDFLQAVNILLKRT